MPAISDPSKLRSNKNQPNINENMSNNTIISTLRATARMNIENVIEYMKKNGFFTKDCHSHHHYDGGLADHAWQTYQCALRFEENNTARHKDHKPLNHDSIAICAILHDFCKLKGMPQFGGHGHRSLQMLKQLGLHLSKDEQLAIRYHMSLRNHKREQDYDNALHCHLRYVVHHSDGESAKMRTGAELS